MFGRGSNSLILIDTAFFTPIRMRLDIELKQKINDSNTAKLEGCKSSNYNYLVTSNCAHMQVKFIYIVQVSSYHYVKFTNCLEEHVLT